MQGAPRSGLTMAYDYGTTSLKAALVDRRGEIVGDGHVGYGISQPRAGWTEQNPRVLWQAGAEAGSRAMQAAGVGADAVRAVVFVAPWKGIVPVGHRGHVLRDALIWMDSRAGVEAQEINETLGEFVGTGQEYWPRLAWLKRHEPQVWADSRWIMGIATYLKWMATGVVATEPSDDFIRSRRPALQQRYAKIIDAAGLADDVGKFPQATRSGEVVGSLTEGAARHLGLRTGTPVYGGFGDLPAITLGAGPVARGATHIYFGTSSWLARVIDAQEEIAAPLRFSIDEHLDGALYPLQTGCLAYDWIVDQVYAAERAALGDRFHAFVAERVASIQAGSGGLLATHWLGGELPPFSKNAKGVFLNVMTTHDRRHMVRAMMECICYTHRMSVEWLEAQTDRIVDDIPVVGGGACSPVWMQMLADILGRTVVVPRAPRFAGAIGAFRCTLDDDRSWPEPTGFAAVPAPRRFEPHAPNRPVYDRMYAAYRQIHPALSGLFDALNGPAAGCRDPRP